MRSSIQPQETFSINGIKIRQIIFDDTDQALIIGDAVVSASITALKIQLAFNQLNDLLRFSGVNGDKVLMAMVDALANTEEPPYSIDVEKILPGKNVFTQCNFVVSLDKSSLFFLIDLQPINIMQQSKNLHSHITHFGYAQLSGPMLASKSLEQLRSQYAYYLGLLELDIKEDAARCKAQIADERLFTMAKIAFTQRLIC